MTNQILVFNKWPTEGIMVNDPGLKRYISVEAVFLPKTGSRYAGNRFYKSKILIVERLINKMMDPGHRGKKHKVSSGHCTGKSTTNYKIVKTTFTMIEQKMKLNPIAVFVKALENAAPREEILTIEYGGARYPKAVEISPQRRVDLALRYMVQGAYQKTFNKKKNMSQTLADEIMNAYQMSTQSDAVTKKLELERQSDSSR